MQYHNIRRPSTGEVKTVPYPELPAGWKPVNGIPFEQAKPLPTGNAPVEVVGENGFVADEERFAELKKMRAWNKADLKEEYAELKAKLS
tara:strand:- start:102 stop:368 length:267 start_codon:yes stop_codon:yes gene_type:complete